MAQQQPTFAEVLAAVGPQPTGTLNQNKTRNYSERLSKEIALWLRQIILTEGIGDSVLTPEAKIPTVYGGKSLDIGVIDQRGYLLLDVSIKTFNFKDRKTANYRKNYTGRFYELLGEQLDLRRSYRWATLVALVFLPSDSVEDSTPSSFAHAVRQFSKILPGAGDTGIGFEHVFVAVHNPQGELYFFDAVHPPPRVGHPHRDDQLGVRQVMSAIGGTVASRRSAIAAADLPTHTRFRFREPD